MYRAASALLLMLFLLPACSDLTQYDRDTINKALADSLLGVTESQDVTIDIIIDGMLKVRAESPFARTVEETFSTYTRLIGPPVFVTVFDSTGGIETRVRSNEMVYWSQDTVFEFEGDVQVETHTDRRLMTEQLEWNESTRKIFSPGFVIITSPSDSITGYGLRGDDDLIRYTLTRVTGQFSID